MNGALRAPTTSPLTRQLADPPALLLRQTNEEVGDAGQVTTVTFEERAGKTLVVMHELYPSKEALDESCASGVEAGTFETFDQLDEFVVSLSASVGRA